MSAYKWRPQPFSPQIDLTGLQNQVRLRGLHMGLQAGLKGSGRRIQASQENSDSGKSQKQRHEQIGIYDSQPHEPWL